jgi:uronate dehydrogenase
MLDKKIVLTGAGGMIGTVIREYFHAAGRPLVISDLRALSDVRSNETALHGDLSDAAFTAQLLQGADVVIHMAGISNDQPLDVVLPHNFVALNNLYVAAHAQKVERIIFASSNHAIGMYPVGRKIDTRVAVNPDSYYGTSKVWGEALGRMFWEKHGVESVCLRIGSFLPKPVSQRNLSTWLSHRDFCALLDASVYTEGLGFEIVYGVSANTRSWWDNSTSRVPYRPQDNAEDFAAAIAAAGVPVDPREALYQGGDYAARNFDRAG